MSLTNIWRNFITSGLNLPKDKVAANRVVFINIFSLIGFFTELTFSLVNIINGSYLISVVELLTAITLLLNMIILRNHKDINLAARIMIMAVAAPLMIMLLGGATNNTGLFWLPTFPVAAYLLLGKKQGSTALLILFLVIGLLTLLESFDLVELAYSFISIRQIILSLLVLTVVLYVHENLKEQRIELADKKTKKISKAYKKIKQTEELRDEFTMALAHELRNALVAIQKLSETWQSQLDNTSRERTEEYIGLIHESATDNLTLVDSLLDVMNIDTADFTIEKKLSNLRQLIDQQVKFFEPQAHKAKVSLAITFDDETPWQLNMDNFRIKQVLANLLSNAVKHTAPGNTISIQVLQAVDVEHLQEKADNLKLEWYLPRNIKELENEKNFVFIGISHPEEGISKEDMPKLFKKFSRLQSHDQLHPPKGRGLGLYISKRIIKSHEGSCGVGSREGKGVTFYVTLPIQDIQSETGEKQASEKQS